MSTSNKSLKIVLLGDSNVGKSSLVLRFVHDTFDEHNSATIGAAFVSKDVINDNGERVKLEVWDTGGQERFRSMANLYYRNASAALVVYDVTDRESFDAMQVWVKELDEKAPKNLTVVIVGNKIDLNNRQIDTNFGENYARTRDDQTNQTTLYVETSAKTGENVDKTFLQLANISPVVQLKSGVQLPPKGVRRGDYIPPKQSKCCK